MQSSNVHIQANQRVTPKQYPLPFYCHLLVFVGIVVPFGNIIAPLVLWLAKRQEDKALDKAGREVLAFQATVTCYSLAFSALMMIPFIGVFFASLSFFVFTIGGVYVLYLLIKGCIAASKGEEHTYPHKLKFIEDAIAQLK